MNTTDLTTTINTLNERKKVLLTEIDSINSVIHGLSFHNIPAKAGSKQSTLTWPPSISNMKDKILHIINTNKRFMHTREISREFKRYGDYRNENVSDIIKKLSSAVNSLKNENLISKFQSGTSNKYTYWGIPDWMNEYNEPLEEYMYRSDALS